jgi:NAD(P)-dependent dehydrogenase (short-subunit alcohol dehydrogenase family)
MTKTILITGASKGIGRSIGVALQAVGHTVIGSSRRPHAEDAPFRLLALDVTEDASVLTYR